MKKMIFKIKGKFTLFFSSTLLILTLYPFFLNSNIGIILLHVFITSVLIAGIELVSYHKKVLIFGTLLGILSIILTWANFFQGNKLMAILWSLCLLVFYIFIAICILILVAQSKRVTPDTILGAISGYLIIPIAWAMLFYCLELLQPKSFNLPHGVHPNPDLFIYFSQTTIASVGFGEITPATPIARSLTALLGMTGQLYLAVLVAILIGIYLVQFNSK